MKRILSFLLTAALLVSVFAVASVSAASVLYGDMNSDGKLNNRDLALLQQHLNGKVVTIDLVAADMYADGKVNNRDLALFQKYLNGQDVTLGPDEPDEPEVTPAELPAVGYDIDGRGRVLVDAISQEGNVVTVVLKNHNTKWITEETAYVEYTCTDAEGHVLTLDSKYYGTLYIGMLEVGKSNTYLITLPEGTTKLEFGNWYIKYWSQWS